MTETTRITPAEVVEAYRKTGMRVARGVFVSSDGTCGCGMGVYAVAYLGAERGFHSINVPLDSAGFSAEYQNGFADGFDGEPTSLRDEPEYVLGFKDGVDAYAAAKDAFNADR